MFIDSVCIKLVAGKGGNGIVAWRRERYIAKGGPYGGNGGKGGDVEVVADSSIYSLDFLRNKRVLKASNGQIGGSNNQQGGTGKNLVLKIPCGTILKDAKTGEIIKDFINDKDKITICYGGRGGRGNSSFKSSTNRAPNYCTVGSDGEERDVILELKLIADVGFVGFPNAGKSTLISSIANRKVKIAPYPFTTLSPNIGYIEFSDFSRILIADIPGIIGGAHENKGLGFDFLKHIERTSVLVYVLDVSCIDGRTPYSDLEVLINELSQYDASLISRPSVVVLNKIDEVNDEYKEEFYKNYNRTMPVYEISAKEKIGLKEFLIDVRKKAQANGKRFY